VTPHVQDPLMTEARVRANRRASREGRPMCIYETRRVTSTDGAVLVGIETRTVVVYAEGEPVPTDAELVEVIGATECGCVQGAA
jgi:hypothetical protein